MKELTKEERKAQAVLLLLKGIEAVELANDCFEKAKDYMLISESKESRIAVDKKELSKLGIKIKPETYVGSSLNYKDVQIYLHSNGGLNNALSMTRNAALECKLSNKF